MNVFSSAPELDLNALFNHASIGIMVSDDEGYIIIANPFLLKMFGYELSELTGKKLGVLLPGGHNGEEAINYLSDPAERNVTEYEAIKKNGEVFSVAVSLSPHYQHGNKYITAFINDITLRKKAESELLEAKAKDLIMEVNLLREMQLNELKTKFVSMASHEFRLPLSAILSSTYLISQYGQKGNFEQQEKHVNKIKNSVSVLTGILNNFLSIEKIEGGSVEPTFSEVAIADYFTNIIEEVSPLMNPGQKVIYQHTGERYMQTDITLLRHIMTNLLSNAVKYSPKTEHIYLFSACTATGVVIRVEDHGIGIPAEDQANIFDRFYRAANSLNVQGTGLGLSIIAGYVKLLKGNITFESEEGKGTTFIVRFPAR